jgi:hypothetical protein
MDMFGNGCARLAFQAWPYRAIHIAISHMLNAMQRLFPNPVASLTVADAYGVTRTRVDVGGGKSRPTIGMCMVHSIDGSTVVEGNSRALGSPGDLAVLLGLRALADVIIVGSSTVTLTITARQASPVYALAWLLAAQTSMQQSRCLQAAQASSLLPKPQQLLQVSNAFALAPPK